MSFNYFVSILFYIIVFGALIYYGVRKLRKMEKIKRIAIVIGLVWSLSRIIIGTIFDYWWQNENFITKIIWFPYRIWARIFFPIKAFGYGTDAGFTVVMIVTFLAIITSILIVYAGLIVWNKIKEEGENLKKLLER